MVAGNAMDIIKMQVTTINELKAEITVLTRELHRANGFHESAAGKLFDSEQECKTLKAQVKRYRGQLINAANNLQHANRKVSWLKLDDVLASTNKFLNESPSQSLAEIQAGALEQFHKKEYERTIHGPGWFIWPQRILDEASYIRQQALENKS